MDVTLEESTTEKVSLLLQECVKRILEGNQTPDSVQKDLLFILIVVLMIENGFQPIDEKLEAVDIMNFNLSQLSKWKLPSGICEATFILSGFKNITLRLLMSPMGSAVLVNLVLNEELSFETYSICLPVSRYVVSPQATTIPMIFRDLKHFSVTFKNKVVTPVKSIILSFHGYASASLVGLPEEVFFKIMLYLPVSNIINVSKTCTRLKAILDNPSLWHCLCKRDFQDQSVMDTQNWKEVYKKKYEAEQHSRAHRLRRAGSMHDNMDYADYVSYVDNPMWNII